MNIAIIGAGNVGSTLGKGWSKKGHNVIYGIRNIDDEKYRHLKDHAKLASPENAAKDSEIIVLATPWSATEQAIISLEKNYEGKILVDCTNPLKPDLSGLTLTGNTSGGEQVAQWAKGASVVKAFNTTGFNIMAAPEIHGKKTAMLVASDNDEARKTIATLAEELDFDAVEFGGLASARLMEPYALVWITLAYKHGLGREFGFAIHKKEIAQ